MEGSFINICGAKPTGAAAVIMFLVFVASIFAFGYIAGHHAGIDEAVDRISKKIDSVESK